jgi:RHS repeat-associated protein
VTAQYEYSPFGEVLSSTGTAASANPMRFSTKYQDTETGLYYYGYRYYNPSTGRWLNRDQIEEIGGENLYAFCHNSPVLYFDYLGTELVYWSEGYAFRDPGYYTIWGSQNGLFRHFQSEKQNSASAFYEQYVMSLPGAVAICNTTLGNTTSSYVEAHVRNESPCKNKYAFTCIYTFKAIVVLFRMTGSERRGISLTGELLEERVDEKWAGQSGGFSLLITAEAGKGKPIRKVVTLLPYEEYDLYHLQSQMVLSVINNQQKKHGECSQKRCRQLVRGERLIDL